MRLDARDFDGNVALFARDGTWQSGVTIKHRRDEIRQMQMGIYGEQKRGSVNTDSYRIVSNVEVELNCDRASTRSRPARKAGVAIGLFRQPAPGRPVRSPCLK